MKLEATTEQRELRKRVCDSVRDALQSLSSADDLTAEELKTFWPSLAKTGLYGLPASRDHGGFSLDALSCAIAFEGLGYSCPDGGLILSLAANTLAGIVPLVKIGDEKLKRSLLPALCSGESIAAIAMTEPENGSNISDLKTVARRTSDGRFRISGRKALITNAAIADVFIVFARTDNGSDRQELTAFVVKRGNGKPLVHQPASTLGLRTSSLCEIEFNDVEPLCVLGQEGGGMLVFNLAMEWERAGLAACHVGTMERILEATVKHARSRKSGGKPVGAFQAVAHKIADMKARLEASRWLAYRAAWALDHENSAQLAASTAKLFVSEAFVQTALESMQIHGGAGYFAGHSAERAVRDALASTIYSGTSEIQRNIIARWLGLPSQS